MLLQNFYSYLSSQTKKKVCDSVNQLNLQQLTCLSFFMSFTSTISLILKIIRCIQPPFIILLMSEIQTQNTAQINPQIQQNHVTVLINPENSQKSDLDTLQQERNQAFTDKIQQEVTEDSPPEVKAYFQSQISSNSPNKSMAVFLVYQKMQSLKSSIKQGIISFPQRSRSINELMFKGSIEKEQEKLNEYLQQKNQLEKQLKRMEEVIQGASNSSESRHSKSLKHGKHIQQGSSLSPQEHKRFIQRMNQIKKQNEERRKMKAQYQEQKMKQKQEKQEQIQKQNQQKLSLQKKNEVKLRLEAILKRRQKMKQEQIQSRKRFKSVSQQKRLYEMMEEEYHKSMMLPIIQEKNKILQERSKQIRSVKIEELKEYEKEYLKSKQKMQQKSRSKVNQNWNYKHPAYSQKMIKIMEEEKIVLKIKQEQDKRRIQELKSRQETYKRYLKERFSSVKIDEKKKLEMETIMKKEKSVKEGLTQASMRSIGNKYLMQARSRIKVTSKEKKQSLSASEETSKQVSKIRETYHTKPKTSMSNYETATKDNRISKIDQISSSSTLNQSQKMQNLQIELTKLSQKAHRRSLLKKHTKILKSDEEELENLMSSIKAKMSIIELYKK